MLNKITNERRGMLQQEFLRIVLNAGDKGIHYDEAIEEIEKSVDLTEYEKLNTPGGAIRWKALLTFGVISLVKCGWVKRSKNICWITAEGQEGLKMAPIEMRKFLKEKGKILKEDEEGEDKVNKAESAENSIIKLDDSQFLQSNMLSKDRTVFKRVDYDLSALLHYIDIGDIGLPDIQRPFVWTASKVRDLFDSMYRGFPVGYLLFWANTENGSRAIGYGDKAHVIPHLLIVDGQQRLTSLYSVFRGVKILDQDYKYKHIEIGFRPRDGKFEVSDAAIKRDPEFIPNISELWASGKSSWTMVNDFIRKLEAKRQLTEKQKEFISHNLDRLFDLQKFPFTALEISHTVAEEQVADIFVRINSEGVKLNQGDFILTLLSVFWDEGRKQLEQFCRYSRVPEEVGKPSPFNYFISPDPDQLLRVEVAIGFYRGRLKSAYQLLRGKDLETDEYSPEIREKQFEILKEAQNKVLDLSNWHNFFNCLIGAGFRSQELISSDTCLLYSYAFYLIGKNKFNLPEETLQSVISKFYFMASITNRYVGSFESTVESDLGKIKDCKDANDFIRWFDKMITENLTSDFWSIALPNSLDSSAAQNPAFFAFLAAQNKLNTPVLFSKNQKIGDMLDPSVRANRKALEKHHLFPRNYLEGVGITDLKLINQLANFALIDWGMNSGISDDAPQKYVPKIRSSFDKDEWSKMRHLHALTENWEIMDYASFLEERRKLMAAIIKEGFETIK